jgi:hypothetical protein
VNPLLRDLVEQHHDDGVETIYHGDFTGVLGEYWLVEAISRVGCGLGSGYVCIVAGYCN